jgi:carboxyl-terminal processing protease
LLLASATLAVLLAPAGGKTRQRTAAWQSVGAQRRLEPQIAAAEGTARPQALQTLRGLRVASESIALVRQRYVEPDKFRPRVMVEEALQAVAHLVPEMLVDAPRVGPLDDEPLELRLRMGEVSKQLHLDHTTDLLGVAWQLLTALRFVADHLPADVAAAKVEYAAVNGLLSTLDPYSRMLDPDQWRDMLTSTGGNFGGLGIVIVPADGALTVQQVLPDSPALRVGLQTGDRILQIDGDDTVGMTVDQAVERLRGEVGTTARLMVLRKGWGQPQSVDVIRAVIHLQSVEAKVLENGVAYARVKQFQRGTARELGEAMDRLLAEGAQRLLVLDLRDNPGGLLDEAIRVCDLFVREGPAVTTVSGGGTLRDVRNVTGNGRFADVPLAVLLSAHSASASEVVAGALKFSDRAVVLGEQSFGKGSVQVPFEIGDGALKLTVAKYLVPGDRSIHGTGITPDIGLQFVSATREQVSLYAGPRSARVVGRRLPSPAPPPAPAVTLRVLLPDASLTPRGDQAVTDTPADVMEREPRQRAAILLRRAGQTSAAGTLAAAKDDLVEMARADDAALVEHLRAQGMDWRRLEPETPAKSGKEPATSASLRVDIAGGKDGLQAHAGDILRMSVTLTNTGSNTLTRLHVLTRSDDPNLDGHEQLVGRLDAGQARTVHLAIRVSARHGDLLVPLRVVAVQDGAPLPSADTAMLTVRGRPQPRLAVRWSLDDRASTTPDGVLQDGEQAVLRLELRNDGAGLAQSVTVLGRVPPGGVLRLPEPRLRVGQLAPGATAVALLPVTALRPADRSKLAGKRAQDAAAQQPQLELVLTDELLAVERSEWPELPYVPSGTLPSSERSALLEAQAQWRTGAQITVGEQAVDQLPLPALAGACHLDLSGRVDFAEELPWRRFVTVSVAGIKRFYGQGHGQSVLRFAAPLRFQPGLTTITIAAQAGPRRSAERNVLVHCSDAPSAAARFEPSTIPATVPGR